MYLKSLEIVGFKSFAEKTKLEFEPGMTSIVGPNGCGKSNVSDAVRWVLGEQSAKALRGGKMEDIIFNGTDTAKPLGMAEVSLTLADCENILGVEYNEVTISRRVFRSGEGQYFINKAPCRLKDIQRLFMDTGIGTNSYSIMEQGKIDRILSSNPQDRRAVFEEASGITKFKADKKVAMRKLDQTEANLLRLDDIIREVKRQIISLQRQAGKARRYTNIRDQLRGIELFFTKDRLKSLDKEIHALESRIAGINEQDEAVRHDIETEEKVSAEMRTQIDSVEEEINQLMEKGIETKAELNRLHDLINTNEERITELQQVSDRDSRNAEESRIRLEQHIANQKEEQDRLEKTIADRDAMEKELAEFVERLQQDESRLQDAQRQLSSLRSEQIDVEASQANLQNEMSDIDAQERQNDIRRERLAAELSESTRSLEAFAARQKEMAERLTTLKTGAEQAGEKLEEAKNSKSDKANAIAECREQLSELQSQAAAISAQIKLLNESREDQEGYPEGARKILDKDPGIPYADDDVLGPLAEQIKAEDGYQRVLETVMRPLLDAIVVRHDATVSYFVKEIEKQGLGSVRLVSLRGSTNPVSAPSGTDRLVDHLSCPAELNDMVERLFGNVVVVNDAAELPNEASDDMLYVSRNGGLIAVGQGECWNPDSQAATPLARHHLLTSWQQESEAIAQQVEQLQTRLQTLQQEDGNYDKIIEECRAELDEARRNLAVAEGESQIVEQEAHQMSNRVDTIKYELEALSSSNNSGDDRRSQIQTKIDELRDRQTEIRTTVSSLTESMRELEEARTGSQRETTERRVRFSELKQNADHISSRIEQLGARVKELESVIDERTRGVSSCQDRMNNLTAGITSAKEKISPVETSIKELSTKLGETRGRKDELNASFAEHGKTLRQKREMLEELHKKHGNNEVELAEQKMRKENIIERVTGEYRITIDDIYRAKEPEWEDDKRPDMETIETTVAELRAKLESMGPVNLVAIEEHAELEERYAFLTAQQTDLVNAKNQLTEMIKEINKTTTEMFSETFNKVNENFQGMFTQIFGGGSAKLVLIDEGDVLESGIEIIARPPGKKLQTVSLLSGGERTMTAVALLFSLYMVKPSPFCVLDELDAALDDANIGRFVKVVQGFVDKSQFIIITHNRQTIAASQAIYGVTMEKRGISKIISAKFADYEKKTDTPAARQAEAKAEASSKS